MPPKKKKAPPVSKAKTAPRVSATRTASRSSTPVSQAKKNSSPPPTSRKTSPTRSTPAAKPKSAAASKKPAQKTTQRRPETKKPAAVAKRAPTAPPKTKTASSTASKTKTKAKVVAKVTSVSRASTAKPKPRPKASSRTSKTTNRKRARSPSPQETRASSSSTRSLSPSFATALKGQSSDAFLEPRGDTRHTDDRALSSTSTNSSGWDEVPSSLFSQQQPAMSSSASSNAPQTTRQETQRDDAVDQPATLDRKPPVSRKPAKKKSKAKAKKGRVDASEEDADVVKRQENTEAVENAAQRNERTLTPPRTPTRSKSGHGGEAKDVDDGPHVGSPDSLTADSEGRRSTTAFRISLLQQQHVQEEQRRLSDDLLHTATHHSGEKADPAVLSSARQDPIAGPAVVKALFQCQPRGISCDPEVPDVGTLVEGKTAAPIDSRDVPSHVHQGAQEEEEEVLIPSDAEETHDREDEERSLTRRAYSFDASPPPAYTATPPPSTLTLAVHQLPITGDADCTKTPPNASTSHDSQSSGPALSRRRISLSLAGAISPGGAGQEASSNNSSITGSRPHSRIALDVDADREIVEVVEGRRPQEGLYAQNSTDQVSRESHRVSPLVPSPPCESVVLNPCALPHDPTSFLDPATSDSVSQHHHHSRRVGDLPPLPLSPSPQAPPRASQGHLRLGSVSRPRSPATIANPSAQSATFGDTATAHTAPNSTFQTPPRLLSRLTPMALGEGSAGKHIGASPAQMDTARTGSHTSPPREDAAHGAVPFPREPPVWRSPQPTRLGPPVSSAATGSASATASHAPSPFNLSRMPTPSTTRPLSHAPVHSTDGRADTPSRPSAQLVTRAAAARPTAAPATMWICIDDEDDDDIEIPTSPTSPTLKHVVIGPRQKEGTTAARVEGSGQVPSASPELSVPAPLAAVKKEWSGGGGISGEEEQRDFLHKAHLERLATLAEEKRRAEARKASREPSPPMAPTAATTTTTATASAPAAPPPAIVANTARPLREPIADVLSPTFRPRRGVMPLSKAPTQRLSPLPSGCYIRMDDDDDDDNDSAGDDEAHNSALDPPSATSTRRGTSGPDHGRSSREAGYAASLPSSPLRQDGSSNASSASPVRLSSSLRILAEPIPDIVVKNDDTDSEDDTRGTHTTDAKGTAQAAEEEEEEAETSTPLRSIQQLLFPARHAHDGVTTSHAGGGGGGGGGAGDGLFFRTAAAASTHGDVHGKKAAKKSRGGAATEAGGDGQGWGRPVDVLQREFFSSKLTKKCFMEAAHKAISEEHFLQPGEFWSAFESAEFVGEGSFGLVWRCRSVQGDLVAVKSCPVSLATRANIDDSFSTVREVATMRFLSEMQVPYVLPMHSAFFVSATESLPPQANDALLWRRAQVKKAEAAALEKQVQMLSRGRKKPAARRGKRTAAETNEEAQQVDDAPLTLEEETQKQLHLLQQSETPEEAAERARYEAIRLPRFLSITEEDVLEGEATIFLVLELCDGDLEGIRRTDGLTKGVAFCVSSALAAMHELGLLHLDLKPSNILYAYEYGPSQQQPQQQQPGLLANPESGVTTPPTGSSVHPGASVKFYLSDFGNCRVVGPNPYDIVEDAFGTFEYMDLAALRDKVCSRATDTFSLGAALYELLFGCRVYPKCQDPKCLGDEDHTRHCFVDAATRPIVLPIADRKDDADSTQNGLLDSALTADTLAARAGLKNANKKTKKSGPAGKTGHGSLAPHGHNKDDDDDTADQSPFSIASSSTMKVSLTVLQKLTAALLQQDVHERMTAAECRACLIKAYNITQEEDAKTEENPTGGANLGMAIDEESAL